MEHLIKNNGLKVLPKDRRDLKLGAIIKLPELSELPDEFILGLLPVENQAGNIAGDDLCSAFGSTLISEFQEGVELSPEWSFAASKELSGDVEGFGQDMRTAMKVHQKYGAVEKSEAVIPDKPRYFKNWDNALIEKAKKHKKEAYVSVEGQYDFFDDIRASIWHYRSGKRAVALGVVWSWDLIDKILSLISNVGYGHFVVAVGWKKINGITYIVIQNSYGEGAGENGRHYISREVVNFFAERYGAMMFLDENPEKLKQQQWSIITKILDAMKKILESMFEQTEIMKKEEEMIESISDEIPPPVKTSRIKDWAEAIKKMEGWFTGSRSYRNNNPGNIRNKDGDYLVFNTPQDGFDYFCDYLTRACEGKHEAYPMGGETTLLGFMEIYAPADDQNDPDTYAHFIALRLGVEKTIKIKELL